MTHRLTIIIEDIDTIQFLEVLHDHEGGAIQAVQGQAPGEAIHVAFLQDQRAQGGAILGVYLQGQGRVHPLEGYPSRETPVIFTLGALPGAEVQVPDHSRDLLPLGLLHRSCKMNFNVLSL
ncbi:hypothetical protein OWV82_004490 [Melia azedarach]|uniref:Uncharacterized protein n=1 Tax=Melia azedarach TaxID=155640 RepID=A0ACC1YQD6_MELAZ|nr:hypothetical protein OWV82_004490 [Melia azedarach]